VIKFGQNQNLASSKSLKFLWLCFRIQHLVFFLQFSEFRFLATCWCYSSLSWTKSILHV